MAVGPLLTRNGHWSDFARHVECAVAVCARAVLWVVHEFSQRLAADNSKELAPVVSAHFVSEKIIAMSRLPHVAGTHVGVECSPARLGGERSMRNPRPVPDQWTDRGAFTTSSSCLSRGGPWGLCRGLGAPSRSGNARPARMFPVPRKKRRRASGVRPGRGRFVTRPIGVVVQITNTDCGTSIQA